MAFNMIQQTTPAGPRPLFVIIREDGSFVPLIAVDELPYEVQVMNVPRRLAGHQLTDMKILGQLPRTGIDYEVRIHAKQPGHAGQGMANAFNVPGGSHSQTVMTRPPPTRGRSLTYKQTYNSQVARPFHKTSKATWSGKPSNDSKKVYCTYWLRTGECDYMQQGCRFKHEMPDFETLKSLGFREVPKWWTDSQTGANANADTKTATKPAIGSESRRAAPPQQNIQTPSKGTFKTATELSHILDKDNAGGLKSPLLPEPSPSSGSKKSASHLDLSSPSGPAGVPIKEPTTPRKQTGEASDSSGSSSVVHPRHFTNPPLKPSPERIKVEKMHEEMARLAMEQGKNGIEKQ